MPVCGTNYVAALPDILCDLRRSRLFDQVPRVLVESNKSTALVGVEHWLVEPIARRKWRLVAILQMHHRRLVGSGRAAAKRTALRTFLYVFAYVAVGKKLRKDRLFIIAM